MNQKTYREILIFVTGTTPQIVTETLYGLTQECQPPVFPDEIHIITTSSGKQKIEEELIERTSLQLSQRNLVFPTIPLVKILFMSLKVKGNLLEDIREASHNESLGDFIANFIREKTEDHECEAPLLY